jgi:hypothetical protein
MLSVCLSDDGEGALPFFDADVANFYALKNVFFHTRQSRSCTKVSIMLEKIVDNLFVREGCKVRHA